MIRFRVIKGSHLLLALAIAVLCIVLALFLLQGTLPTGQTASVQLESAGAKVLSAFASANLKNDNLDIEVLPDPSPSPAAAPGKRILIYHTHTHEAYTQVEHDPYVAVETWRTEDSKHSVVRLGQALTEELRAMGYDVLHDTTDHEQQDISGAYLRSLATLEGYGEDFDLIIDLHRDAHVESLPLSFEHGGTEYAQLMLLVGRGDNYGPEEKPDYSGNLDFARRLTSAMNRQLDGICRNVTVKTGRYNQHMCTPAILVEVGHNKNTLQQALNSIPCLARAIQTTLA